MIKNFKQSLPTATFILTKENKSNLLGFVISYLLIPLLSLFVVLSLGLLQPNSTAATLIAYLIFVTLSIVVGGGIILFRNAISLRTKSLIHMVLSFSLPFLIWYIWTMTLKF